MTELNGELLADSTRQERLHLTVGTHDLVIVRGADGYIVDLIEDDEVADTLGLDFNDATWEG